MSNGLEIKIPLEETEQWMDGLVLSNEHGKLRIEVAKNNRNHYGYVVIDPADLLKAMGILGL